MNKPLPIPLDVLDAESVAALQSYNACDIAELLTHFELEKVREVLRKLPDELAADVVVELPVDLQIQLFEVMRLQHLSGIVNEMFPDDAADVLGELSPERLEKIMVRVDPEVAKKIAALLEFEPDSAGGLMHTEFISVTEDQTLQEAIEALREHEHGVGIFYIYVTDSHHRLHGILRIHDLIFKKPYLKIKDVMIREVCCVSVHADQEEIARLFSKYHYMAIPVVDDFQRLRGVITADDALQISREEATEDMQRMVGLFEEEGMETPWRDAVRSRLPWLYINLATAFLAGWVVSLFEGTIAKYAVLAIFLPIIAGQGGNAGCQTLTILVRGLALGTVSFAQQKKVLFKEILVGLIAGLANGLVVGLISWVWKGSPLLGIITCLAMIANMFAAALAGVLIPLGLKSIKIDPALASCIILTTVTDVFGFLSFLGLASLATYYFGAPV